jgi:hypothetical protein
MERGDECVDAERVVCLVTDSQILHHLPLTRLHGCPNENAAALICVEKRQDAGLEEVGEGLTVRLKESDRPAVGSVLGRDD